ncbi:Tyrosine/nicotianamine aminotransferase [Arabidopsis thaliana x Arabidopsis arenosa]|uniref:Tyrosine/nicotianamine aminotransferase n=1 Tax=Arabidopsis thaliana x Arabidopsis arenosa TaxID=1240361 RepID=A0A8T1Y3V1_9BRAS|nr:Tyrosine/nicotianamine aminotransferase [Arabidopsis thaliana x Arabidopsis arenosa]
MATLKCIDWQFSGSEAAKEAAGASLGTYTSALYAMCDPNGKPILPPRNEILETSNTAEKAVVKAVLYGSGNAYAPSVGLAAAKRAVAEYLNQGLPKKLTADDVFMTLGCKQAIELASAPSTGTLRSATMISFPKRTLRSTLIASERSALVDENTFAIFIINPHNPNGNTYSEAHLKQLAELAKELKIMVVSDEVFRWTLFGSNPFVPMGKFSSIVPVVTLGSISKGWKVPGWRTGWLALHDLDGVFRNTKVLQAAQEYLQINNNPPTVIQAAIPDILEKTPKDFFDKRQSFLKDKVEFGYSKLKHIPSLTCYMKPEACTFLWTELDLSSFVDIEDDQDFCNKLAIEENLVVLPGIAFSQKNWLRHSIDMETPVLEDAMERLKSFCDRHSIKKAPLKDVNGVK